MEYAKKHIDPTEKSTAVSGDERAFLIQGAKKIPIYAGFASKYSLFFRYANDQKFTCSDEHVNLLFQNNGQSIELGPCRILPSSDLNGYAGRLVFLQDVYDVKCLLKNKKVVNLRSTFDDLPAVFARKDKIRPSFKEYIADLAYDLSTYKKVFDDLDSQYREEPEDVRRSIQQAIIETEGQKFMEFFHQKVEELNHLTADFTSDEFQIHGYYFRKQLWNFILCCALMARTNLKPRGYAGDSEMMKMIYRNDYEGDTTFCKLMQKYTVGVPASQSVRNRRKLIMEMLNNLRVSNHSEPQEKIRVLSVACGPAFELADILVSPSDFQKYQFTLLDQDTTALNEAAQFVSEIEKKYDNKVQADYVNMSVRLMFSKRPIKQDLGGKFHFIYSMGLFDYLSTPVAKAVIEKLYQLLKTKGEMVIGNFHVSNPSKIFMEYWGDWFQIHRTEEEFKNLSKDITLANVSTIFEKTGSQMFLHIKKQVNGM